MRGRLTLALTAALGVAATAHAAAPRNVLLILTDDQAYDTLGLTNPQVTTPNLDRLFSDGTWFDRAVASTPACPPSRMSVLTGLYYPAHRFTFEQPKPEPSLLSISYPARLRERGYHSGFVGKNGLHLDQARAKLLFDEWEFFQRDFIDEEGEHLTDRITRSARRFIRQQTAERPWSLLVWFHAPHADRLDGPEPFMPPARYRALYRRVEFDRPPGLDAWPDRPPFFDRGANRLRGERWWSEAEYQRNTRRYHAMVRGIDDAVGTLRETLTATGQADDTLIVFLSDNGFYRGERGFGGKWLGHEASTRIPMAIFDPERPTGNVISELVTNVDVAPTVLERLGFDVPHWMQGESLAPLLAGATVPGWREFIFLEHSWRPSEGAPIPRTRGVRTATHKYLAYPGRSYKELYDLTADPHELVNLAGTAAGAEVERSLEGLAAGREHGFGKELFADGFESQDDRRWPQRRGLGDGALIVAQGERGHPWVLAAPLERKKKLYVGLRVPAPRQGSLSFRFKVNGATASQPVAVAALHGGLRKLRLFLEQDGGRSWLVLRRKNEAGIRMRVRSRWATVAITWDLLDRHYTLWKNGRRVGRLEGLDAVVTRLRFGLPDGGGTGSGSVLLDEFLVISP